MLNEAGGDVVEVGYVLESAECFLVLGYGFVVFLGLEEFVALLLEGVCLLFFWGELFFLNDFGWGCGWFMLLIAAAWAAGFLTTAIAAFILVWTATTLLLLLLSLLGLGHHIAEAH